MVSQKEAKDIPVFIHILSVFIRGFVRLDRIVVRLNRIILPPLLFLGVSLFVGVLIMVLLEEEEPLLTTLGKFYRALAPPLARIGCIAAVLLFDPFKLKSMLGEEMKRLDAKKGPHPMIMDLVAQHPEIEKLRRKFPGMGIIWKDGKVHMPSRPEIPEKERRDAEELYNRRLRHQQAATRLGGIILLLNYAFIIYIYGFKRFMWLWLENRPTGWAVLGVIVLTLLAWFRFLDWTTRANLYLQDTVSNPFGIVSSIEGFDSKLDKKVFLFTFVITSILGNLPGTLYMAFFFVVLFPLVGMWAFPLMAALSMAAINLEMGGMRDILKREMTA